MAVLVNSSMFDRCCSKSVLLWAIFDLVDSTVSLGDFYLRIIQECDCQIEEHELEEAQVGWSKEQLDPVSDLGEYSVSALCVWYGLCVHGLHVWHRVCVGGVIWLVLYLVFLICSCRYAGCCCDISIWKLHVLLFAV